MRRKDGRELVEIFKELSKSTPDPAAPIAPQPIRLEETPLTEQSIVHSIKLGDRKQIELFLSNGWAYGIVLFSIFLLAGAFAAGRHFAPPIAPPAPLDAPEAFRTEAARIEGERINAPAAATGQAATRVYDPQSLALGQGKGSGTGFAGAPPQPVVPGPIRTASGQTQPPQPLPVRALMPDIATGDQMYAICVVTYLNKGGADKDRAATVVKFFQDQGFPQVRALTKKTNNQLIIAIGSFPTRDTPEARQIRAKLANTKYQNSAFKDTLEISLKGYQ